MTYAAGLGARLGITGALECKDKDGNVIEVIHINGSIPLERLGLSVEEAQAIISQQEANHGTHHCE